MVEEYPKKVTLPDGGVLTLRTMAKDDQYDLYTFFVNLPVEDRRFLRNDVTDRKVIENWCRNLNFDRVLPILAESDGKIVANATLHYQTFGWGRHVAEFRITIDREFQGRKLGSLLLKDLSKLAAKSKVEKLVARIVTNREVVIRAFQKAGFNQVAVLKNYVKDIHQQNYADVALLVKEIEAENS
jgi:L-amino acid N-acyltransferase YncA